MLVTGHALSKQWACFGAGNYGFFSKFGPLVLTSSLCVQPQTLIVRTSRELVASKVSWSIEYSKGSDIAGWFHAHALLSVLKREAG